MSWNSVVKRPSATRTTARPTDDATSDDGGSGGGADETPKPPPESVASASTPFAPATHDTTTPTAPARADVAAPPAPSGPAAGSTAGEALGLTTAPETATPTPAASPPPVASPAPSPSIPVAAPDASVPVAATPSPAAEAPPVVPTDPPPATSAPDPVADEPAPTVPDQSAPTAPDIAVAPPTQPNQAISLPAAAAVPSVAPPRQTAAVLATAPRKPKKDRSGSLARLGLFFLVVGALVSAAVIFGRPYLFPEDWDDEALGVAQSIEEARGVDFTEPVLVTPQPTAAHREMVAAQLLGDPASKLPMWRALGLAGPDSTDEATLQTLIAELSPVLYSTADGQVYHDSEFTRSDREFLISQAMATAALDQEFGFSADASNRTLDAAALTEAHVRQQTEVLAGATADQAASPTVDMAPLAFLPAVLDYRLTAPEVFVELLPPINDVDANPLGGIGTQGPGPLTRTPLASVPSESVVAGDAAVGPPVVTDRSFWYLSFASHLDATTAYRMSNQLQGAGLQMVDGSTGRCAVATLTTGDAAANAALESDLVAWATAASPAFGATATALPDSSVQLRSCDPVADYTSNIRFGVARQLIAWRAIELAVTTNVVTQGGDAAAVAAAIADIPSSPAALAAVQLPAGTAPSELVEAARAAATDVIVAGSLPDAAGES